MSFYTLSIIPIFVLSLVLPTTSQYVAAPYVSPCSDPFKDLTTKRNVTKCQKLTTLRAEFGWTVDEKNNSRVSIVFGTRKHEDMAWMAWGVNPSIPQMVGTRAMLGLRQQNGTSNVATYTITSDTKRHCKLEPSRVEVEFANMSFFYDNESNYMLLSANIGLPKAYSIKKLHMVWQVGYDADGDVPKMHSATLQNFDSIETIDLTMGGRRFHHVGWRRNYLRVIHSALCMAGWGTLLPAGVVVARYAKYPLEWKLEWLPEQWLTIHKILQTAGFLIGTAGWGTGIWLGHASRYYTFYSHRHYAIVIFAFALLQILAWRFKPQIGGPLRRYWNMYHHLIGYALLVLIAVNMFIGIAILKPDQAPWRWCYVGIIIVFALFFTYLEVYAWIKYKTSDDDKEDKIKGVDQDDQEVGKGRVARSSGSTPASTQTRGRVARSTGSTTSSSQPRATTSVSINPI